jgi:PAS domain-containing protein
MAELMMAVKAMTERRMEEIALKRSLERFKRIYGELPVGIEIFDKDGVLSDLNDAALTDTGRFGPQPDQGTEHLPRPGALGRGEAPDPAWANR